MAGWDDLQDASYAGIAYEIVSSHVRGGNVLDKQQFPGRDGQTIDDRAAGPRSFDYVIDFIEGEYPQTLENLLAKLIAGGVNELVDPVHGSLKAACESWELIHDPDEGTDCARLQVHFEEDTGAPLTAEKTTAPAMANAVRSACDDIAAAAAAYQLITDDPAQLQACSDAIALSTNASAAADSLELDGDTMNAGQIQATVNGITSKADAINGVIADYSTPEAYALGGALITMMGSLETFGGAYIAAKPPIIEEPVPAEVNALVYMHERYGDSSRIVELFALNSIPDPLEMTSGLVVRRYAF